jgi:ferredoxin
MMNRSGIGETQVTHVVTDNCLNCRFTECVSVCPVECFHVGDEMLYIDPDTCIDCGACAPVCPVHAIYDEVVIPRDKHEWIASNRERAPTFPVINGKIAPLEGAEARQAELGFAK